MNCHIMAVVDQEYGALAVENEKLKEARKLMEKNV